MAEGLLFNIAEAILKNAGALALQEIGTILGVKDELSKLGQTIPRIQAVLLDAEENQQAHNNQDRQWLDELKELVYKADELLDDFATEGLRRKAMGRYRVIKEVRIFFSGSNQLVYGHIMAGKIKAVRENLKSIADERQSFHLEVQQKEKGGQETDSSPPVVFVGRGADKDMIVKLLVDPNYVKISSIISIVGIGGIGKTALAQVIFNDKQVQENFELKEWVYVSDPFDVKIVVKNILESATNEMQDVLELNTMLNRLKGKLDRNKFLIVLDDVWSEDGEKWDNVKKLLRVGAKGSKIIVTTRSMEVARIASPSSHTLDGLSLADSWSLLRQMVFGVEEVKNPYVVNIGGKIVRRCYGVPLAIKSIGNLLHPNDPETQWLHFVNQDPLIAARNENAILPRIKSSYDHLPSHLKHCFAYCSLFPKDFVIDVDTLIHLWVGQGFITKSLEASQCLEDIGLEYFMDLLQRSFFQVVKKDSLGNVKSCKLSHLMHRLAATVAASECKLVMQNENTFDAKTRHLSLNFVLEPLQEIPTYLRSANQVRTFLLPAQEASSSSGRWKESSTKALFSCFKRLRVLDLHDMVIENVSPSVEKLKQLRYLDMSRNAIRLLPRSITKLQNLQVLKLSDCKELTKLPKEFRKLVNLKHLYNEGCLNLTHMPIGLGNMTSLQTLAWFVVSKDGPISKDVGGLNELNILNYLRGRMEVRNLGYRNSGESEFKTANIGNKSFLQSLILRWNGEADKKSTEAIAEYDEKALSDLQPHPNLRELQVYEYRGVSFPSWLSSLTNLINIRLESCQRCQSLPPLDQIHSLKELWIIDSTDLEYIVSESTDYPNRREDAAFFPSLKKFVLLNCPKLKGWKKATDASIDALAALPHFSTLSLLEVKNCPELTLMPRLPSLSGRLNLKNTTSLEPVEQLLKIKMMLYPNQGLRLPSWLASPTNLVEIWITDCKGYESLPAFDQIGFLKDLYIDNLPDLKYIDMEKDSSEEEPLAFFPFLKKLWIWNCPNLTGWQKISDGDNGTASTTLTKLPQFPCLSLLDIRECHWLSTMPRCSPTLEEKLFLSSSSLLKIPSNLPSFINLTQIWIEGFKTLKYLDIERDSYFTTGAERSTIFPCLKKLWIQNCPELQGWWKKRDDEDSTLERKDFPQFACLSFLEIRHCPKLSWMPLFPTLEERFYFVNAGLHSFPSTISSLANLKELWISDVAGLKYIESDGGSCLNCKEKGSPFFPHLQYLYIYDCYDLEGWWKQDDNDLTTTISNDLPHFPRLSFLEIKNCPQLTWVPLFPTLEEKLILKNSSIKPLEQTMKMTNSSHPSISSLSSVPPLSNLKILQIEKITDLVSLPEEWLKNLKSLETFTIDNCESLACLPQAMCQLTSLKTLEIKGCSQLKQRCQRNTGIDWLNITCIPQILFDGEEI